ncbi:hypothetical protein K493DRAFT_339441 [Basidiobolus meristosporus CBS 931.73]|uniref:Small ribosomal subunit protein mS38 n=1 Tax=Basidiobolus meristosporus CBS 931.73 TaxID=1314790 RepID=A0A1Y1XZV9_9FUNG|nr:hypothetical protein K493DRAFT_339441 [Basidiobolus meristosporus CBS 931.73]|eukprot:ORX91293.1 hypothetical protein K493DRAFT_339441 [Basidiobolus meristosporus CBS 931.73]
MSLLNRVLSCVTQAPKGALRAFYSTPSAVPSFKPTSVISRFQGSVEGWSSLNVSPLMTTPARNNVLQAESQQKKAIDFLEAIKQKYQTPEAPKETLLMTSILRKRKLKMNKHKYKKLRKNTRALRKRLGK